MERLKNQLKSEIETEQRLVLKRQEREKKPSHLKALQQIEKEHEAELKLKFDDYQSKLEALKNYKPEQKKYEDLQRTIAKSYEMMEGKRNDNGQNGKYSLNDIELGSNQDLQKTQFQIS